MKRIFTDWLFILIFLFIGVACFWLGLVAAGAH